jgi:hypothetical protein
MAQFGHQSPLVIQIGPENATTIAVDSDRALIPTTMGPFRVRSVNWTQDAPSTSGTVAIRYITDDSAAGAAASATVVEMITALGTDGADDTVRTATLAGVTIPAGARIATKTGGTQTNLVGLIITMVLDPIDQL